MTPAVWLRRLLLRQGRTHRVTTITRTVTREKGEPQESRETVEEVEVVPVQPETRDAALHVSIAVTSVVSVVAAAFLLGWVLRKARR